MSSTRIPRPLSPTDAAPAAVALAAGDRVIELSQCVAPHARPGTHWSSSGGTAAFDHRTLPLCAELHSDAAGRETVPFALSVSSDSYRHSLLQSAKTQRSEAAAASAKQSPHISWDARSVFATPGAPLLSLSDLSRLSDALLCNTSLTCLDFGRALPAGSMPTLTLLLQQHPSLVSINLAGNALGAGGADTEALRALCATLASPLSLPHLATLDLAHNQFTPRCLEIVCTTVLRSAPSLQSLDWRGNEVGLRGGWAIVDALRLRTETSSSGTPLAPVTSLLLECTEEGLDGAVAAAADSGLPPHPNVSTTLASAKPRPAYWARIQQLLRENRQRADLTLLEHQRAQALTSAQEKHEEQKEAVVAAVAASKLPPLSTSASTSSIAPGESYARVVEGTAARSVTAASQKPPAIVAVSGPSSSSSSAVPASDPAAAAPPSFIPPALFHASLGRLVSELNQERATRFERQEQLSAALQREERLQNQLHEMEAAARSAARRLEELQSNLAKGAAHIRDLEGSLLAQKTKESQLVSSHAAQMASMDSRALADSTELARVHADLSRLRHELTEERGRTRAALRASSEMAADRARGQGSHSAGLRDLERRVEQLRWERTQQGANAAGALAGSTTSAAGTGTGASITTPPRSQQHPYTISHHSPPESLAGSTVAAAGVLPSSKPPPRPTSSGSSGSTGSLHLAPAAVTGSGFKSSLNLKPTPLSLPLSLSPGSVATNNAAAGSGSTSAAASASSSPSNATAGKSPRTGLSISVEQAQAMQQTGGSQHQLRPLSSPLPSPGSGSAPISPRSPASPSSAVGIGSGGSLTNSGYQASPALSPSLSIFSSTAPPLPPSVLSPQHGLQLMPHHLPTWQQPPPEPKPLKLKPKQRGT